jgi:predicted membrane-bound dolichyl-phosphate-mannose-protein mannosyltransferase
MGSGPAGSPSNTAPPVGDPGAPVFTPEQLAALPHDNAGPKLTALIWTMNAAAAVFIALRMYCKTSRGKHLWWDDYILLASWVTSFRPPGSHPCQSLPGPSSR